MDRPVFVVLVHATAKEAQAVPGVLRGRTELAAEKSVPDRDHRGVDVGRRVRQEALDLVPERGRDAFVRVDLEDPVASSLADRDVALSAVAAPRGPEHARARGLRDGDGRVGGSGVHDDYLVTKGDALESAREPLLLVEDDHARGDGLAHERSLGDVLAFGATRGNTRRRAPATAAHAFVHDVAVRRILVGYDGSDGGRRALDRAIAEARESRGRIVVLSVANMPLSPDAPRHFGTLDDISAARGRSCRRRRTSSTTSRRPGTSSPPPGTMPS